MFTSGSKLMALKAASEDKHHPELLAYFVPTYAPRPHLQKGAAQPGLIIAHRRRASHLPGLVDELHAESNRHYILSKLARYAEKRTVLFEGVKQKRRSASDTILFEPMTKCRKSSFMLSSLDSPVMPSKNNHGGTL
jgi:hypothetical protein